MAFNPTKVRLQFCNINGVEARLHVNCIKVYESMCKPYLTAAITVIDNSNFINGLGLRGGEPVTFAFDGGGSTYDQDMYILTIDGEQSTDSLRTIIYTITCASVSYFNDKANLVQRSDTTMSATAAAAAIHNQYVGGDYPLQVKMGAMGMLGKPDGPGWQTSDKKPFKAIDDLLKRAVYGGVGTGSTVYFRDANSYVMAPLEHLFNTMSPQTDAFVQMNTWGQDWKSVFETTHIVISALTKKDEDQGRGGAGMKAAAAKGALNIFGIAEGEELINKAGSAMGGASKFASGKWGGIQNVLQNDSRRNPLSIDPGVHQPAVNAFQARVKDGVNYLIKVPIQGGIDCTVGKGIFAKLIPPMGDQRTMASDSQSIGGLMLVADLCHECYFDARLVQGTTTFRAVQI